MVKATAQSNKSMYGVNRYIADTESDVSSLPSNCAPGSSCLVAASGNTYIFNNSKEWILLGSGGSSSGGTSSGGETTWQAF